MTIIILRKCLSVPKVFILLYNKLPFSLMHLEEAKSDRSLCLGNQPVFIHHYPNLAYFSDTFNLELFAFYI